MGQGAWTALVTMAARSLGLHRDAIRLDTDGSHLPAGAGTLASTGTYSNARSIHAAATKLHARLIAAAIAIPTGPFTGSTAADIRIADGILRGPGNAQMSVADVVATCPGRMLSADATTGRDFGRASTKKATFGACFVEISLDPITMEVAVEHVVGAFAGGRIIEPAIARSQLIGGMIWGIGQALMEESVIDPRTGRWLNADLAEALIPTQADVGRIKVMTVEDDDPGDPVGMKGLSEIGVMGPGPAIANAIFDATGHRIRHLPIRIDDLMGARA
jgi:xanthine dehydrogenase YagR molybdenum-binding subunit